MSGGPPAAASSTSAISRKFGALVRRPAEAIHLRILRGANRAGFTDLVQAHLAVLRYPGPEGRPALGSRDRSRCDQAGDELPARYRERRADPDDQRSRRVHLTPMTEEQARAIVARGLALR
jgi:hypothetical protein